MEPVEGTVCTIEGCEKPRGRSRYCSMHKARIARHGDPDVCINPQDRAIPSGPDHPGWKEQGTYTAVHQRLVKVRGRAAEHECFECGEPAQSWAYRGPRQPGDEQPFSTNLDDYEPMCWSCHRTYDNNRLRDLSERNGA